MQITIWGAGFCAPSPNKPLRSYTGCGIDIGSNYLLFDIGGGVLHKMLMDGIDVMVKPTHLFISHRHIDHTLDIFQLMQGRCVETRNRKIEKMFIGTPPNFSDVIRKVWDAYGEDFKLEDVFDINNVSEGVVVENNEFKVTCAPVKHIEGSTAYKLEVDGKSIVYSGDMGYDEKICELGQNADIAILECSFPEKSLLIGNHLCPEDIGKLAKIGGFKKVVLTHMAPLCEGRENEMVEKIKSLADCEVVVGEDLLKIDL